MTPTLMGRIQTRIFLMITIGVLVTAVVTPALGRPAWASLSMAYRITFKALAVVTVVGVGWELLYHLAQQLRWDKDWPSMFGLLAGLNEAVLLWYLLHAMSILPGTSRWASPLLWLFVVHFVVVWVTSWLFMQGPLRVVHLRWRFEGGRIF